MYLPKWILVKGDITMANREPDHNVPPLIPSIIDCALEIASSRAVMIHEAEPLMHHNNQDSSLSETICNPHKAFPIEDVVIEFQDASEHSIDPEIGDKEQELYFFDTSDDFQPCARLGKAFHLSLDYESFLRDHEVDSFIEDLDQDELFGQNISFDGYGYVNTILQRPLTRMQPNINHFLDGDL